MVQVTDTGSLLQGGGGSNDGEKWHNKNVVGHIYNDRMNERI